VRQIVPDTHIVEWKPNRGASTAAGCGMALAEAGVAATESRFFILEDDPTTEGFIEIRDADGGQLVTVIEFLSPSNKLNAEGTAKYRQNQMEVMASATSLVEIDLVRTGRRVLAMPYKEIPIDWRADSLVLIRKGWEGKKVELLRLPLRDRLPVLSIPLRPHEPPAPLDLQAIHDECCRKGRYDRLNYAVDPVPPLADSDHVWAGHLLISAGKR
jgi:hypothetical protein